MRMQHSSWLPSITFPPYLPSLEDIQRYINDFIDFFQRSAPASQVLMVILLIMFFIGLAALVYCIAWIAYQCIKALILGIIVGAYLAFTGISLVFIAIFDTDRVKPTWSRTCANIERIAGKFYPPPKPRDSRKGHVPVNHGGCCGAGHVPMTTTCGHKHPQPETRRAGKSVAITIQDYSPHFARGGKPFEQVPFTPTAGAQGNANRYSGGDAFARDTETRVSHEPAGRDGLSPGELDVSRTPMPGADGEGMRVFHCTGCGARFTREMYALFKSQKRFFCEYCGKGFRVEAELPVPA